MHIFERIARERALPQVLRTDNGPEFLGEVFVQWARVHGMAIQYIQPGKPNQNAHIERFNRTCREGTLDQHLFARLEGVREATWQLLVDYNEHRHRNALGSMTPAEYRIHYAGISTSGVCLTGELTRTPRTCQPGWPSMARILRM